MRRPVGERSLKLLEKIEADGALTLGCGCKIKADVEAMRDLRGIYGYRVIEEIEQAAAKTHRCLPKS